ncbi:MAG: hypothetical protein KatS3mg028_0061 [Bacteroidia bacterium]|nr:MAG: hypothetical protein KatS3mg028_0061 [Bacteroidia bacterium]
MPLNLKKDIYHTVKKGETIYSIAKKYNVNVSQIAELNNISTQHKVKIGEKLLIKKSN